VLVDESTLHWEEEALVRYAPLSSGTRPAETIAPRVDAADTTVRSIESRGENTGAATSVAQSQSILQSGTAEGLDLLNCADMGCNSQSCHVLETRKTRPTRKCPGTTSDM
jgi:hypothetical protein